MLFFYFFFGDLGHNIQEINCGNIDSAKHFVKKEEYHFNNNDISRCTNIYTLVFNSSGFIRIGSRNSFCDFTFSYLTKEYYLVNDYESLPKNEEFVPSGNRHVSCGSVYGTIHKYSTFVSEVYFVGKDVCKLQKIPNYNLFDCGYSKLKETENRLILNESLPGENIFTRCRDIVEGNQVFKKGDTVSLRVTLNTFYGTIQNVLQDYNVEVSFIGKDISKLQKIPIEWLSKCHSDKLEETRDKHLAGYYIPGEHLNTIHNYDNSKTTIIQLLTNSINQNYGKQQKGRIYEVRRPVSKILSGQRIRGYSVHCRTKTASIASRPLNYKAVFTT